MTEQINQSASTGSKPNFDVTELQKIIDEQAARISILEKRVAAQTRVLDSVMQSNDSYKRVVQHITAPTLCQSIKDAFCRAFAPLRWKEIEEQRVASIQRIGQQHSEQQEEGVIEITFQEYGEEFEVEDVSETNINEDIVKDILEQRS